MRRIGPSIASLLLLLPVAACRPEYEPPAARVGTPAAEPGGAPAKPTAKPGEPAIDPASLPSPDGPMVPAELVVEIQERVACVNAAFPERADAGEAHLASLLDRHGIAAARYQALVLELTATGKKSRVDGLREPLRARVCPQGKPDGISAALLGSP